MGGWLTSKASGLRGLHRPSSRPLSTQQPGIGGLPLTKEHAPAAAPMAPPCSSVSPRVPRATAQREASQSHAAAQLSLRSQAASPPLTPAVVSPQGGAAVKGTGLDFTQQEERPKQVWGMVRLEDRRGVRKRQERSLPGCGTSPPRPAAGGLVGEEGRPGPRT